MSCAAPLFRKVPRRSNGPHPLTVGVMSEMVFGAGPAFVAHDTAHVRVGQWLKGRQCTQKQVATGTTAATAAATTTKTTKTTDARDCALPWENPSRSELRPAERSRDGQRRGDAQRGGGGERKHAPVAEERIESSGRRKHVHRVLAKVPLCAKRTHCGESRDGAEESTSGRGGCGREGGAVHMGVASD